MFGFECMHLLVRQFEWDFLFVIAYLFGSHRKTKNVVVHRISVELIHCDKISVLDSVGNFRRIYPYMVLIALLRLL